MVNLVQRMRRLKTRLLDIRIGPGAAILPPDVKRIHLSFAYKFNDGHLGSRRVWRYYLPRLKYHNPAVSMTVSRSHDQAGPATLSVFFAPSSDASTHSATSSPAPTSSTSKGKVLSEHTPWERVEAIDMKYKRPEEILERLIEVTRAEPVLASPEDEAEFAQLEEEKERSEKDRERVMADTARARRERELLEQARNEVI